MPCAAMQSYVTSPGHGYRAYLRQSELWRYKLLEGIAHACRYYTA